LSDPAGFLSAMLADPDDDTSRLVYADWLEERGDPRSELLRVQLRLAAWVPDIKERTRLQQRERELISEHGERWMGELGPLCKEWSFQRGTARITMDARRFGLVRFGPKAPALFEHAWVESVRLPKALGSIAALTATPALGLVGALDLSRNKLTTVALEKLLASPHLDRLVSLDLSNNQLGDGVVLSLKNAGLLERLLRLDLRNNTLTRGGTRRLLEATRDSRMRHLGLQGNEVDGPGTQALIEWRDQREQRAVSHLVTNTLGMEFVRIPAGTFRMGSDESEEHSRDNEKPAHVVKLTKPFYLGAFAVTQQQYEAVMGENPSFFDKGRRGGPHHPVEEVSWRNAAEFCKRLSELPAEKKAGRVYRLPTEAEWEHACRVGTTTPFHHGFIPSTELVNYDGHHVYGGVSRGIALSRTTPVGSYPPNAWGLHDMHGNVWEWCHDYHNETYFKRCAKKDPKGPSRTRMHTMKGGCWDCVSWYTRAAHRHGDPTDHTDNFTGFRVALDLGGK
jgi:uncharacterized protein (TIGR02996 family)